MTLLARRPLCSMFRDVPAQYFAGQEQPEVADRQCPHQVAAPVAPPGPIAADLQVRGSRDAHGTTFLSSCGRTPTMALGPS
jgi:hypothetical protein